MKNAVGNKLKELLDSRLYDALARAVIVVVGFVVVVVGFTFYAVMLKWLLHVSVLLCILWAMLGAIGVITFLRYCDSEDKHVS